MKILAINSVGPACEAAVLSAGGILSCISEPMQRGHDVRLPAVVKALGAFGNGFCCLQDNPLLILTPSLTRLAI